MSQLVLRTMWPKYWRFSFSISPSNEHSRLLSFKMECFDLLAVRGALKGLLQCHNWKASRKWIFGGEGVTIQLARSAAH